MFELPRLGPHRRSNGLGWRLHTVTNRMEQSPEDDCSPSWLRARSFVCCFARLLAIALNLRCLQSRLAGEWGLSPLH